MTCDRFRPQLALLVGNDLDPREAVSVRQHLGVCPSCQAHWDALQASIGTLHELSRLATHDMSSHEMRSESMDDQSSGAARGPEAGSSSISGSVYRGLWPAIQARLAQEKLAQEKLVQHQSNLAPSDFAGADSSKVAGLRKPAGVAIWGGPSASSNEPAPSWWTVGAFSAVCSAIMWLTISTPVFDFNFNGGDATGEVAVIPIREVNKPVSTRLPELHLVEAAQPPVQIFPPVQSFHEEQPNMAHSNAGHRAMPVYSHEEAAPRTVSPPSYFSEPRSF